MSKPKRIKPQVRSSVRIETELLPQAKLTGPGIIAKPSPPGKRGLQLDSAHAEKKFNRGAVKPWIPPGGRAPQKVDKTPPPKQITVAKGPGYNDKKGYKVKK